MVKSRICSTVVFKIVMYAMGTSWERDGITYGITNYSLSEIG